MTSETIIGGEMLGALTQCHTFVIYDDACSGSCSGLKSKLRQEFTPAQWSSLPSN